MGETELGRQEAAGILVVDSCVSLGRRFVLEDEFLWEDCPHAARSISHVLSMEGSDYESGICLYVASPEFVRDPRF